MWRTWLLGVVLIGGCGSHRPAEVSARPPGKGWSCYTWADNRKDHLDERKGKCLRVVADCDKSRTENTSSPDAICSPQATAYCFTARDTNKNAVVPLCSPTADQCGEERAFLSTMAGSPLSDPSGCDAWE